MKAKTGLEPMARTEHELPSIEEAVAESMSRYTPRMRLRFFQAAEARGMSVTDYVLDIVEQWAREHGNETNAEDDE
jgi:hypothetical protein